MTEHVHGCLNCRPDMVPDFSKDDPRYHAYEKCGATLRVMVGGRDAGYTRGAFEGFEGWALVVAADGRAESVHDCPSCSGPLPAIEGSVPGYQHSICMEPRFGRVGVIHDCTAGLTAQIERLKSVLEPLVPEAVFWRAVFGRDVY